MRLVLLVLLTMSMGLGSVAPVEAGETPWRDQTVLVTGANRGLGLEFVRQLQAAGATVIGSARRP